VDRLQEVWAFSIFESIALDISERRASSAADSAAATRYSRTRAAMTRSRACSPGTLDINPA